MTQTYLKEFEAFTTNGGSKARWVQPLRQSALGRFQALGFPTARDEDWRFTNIAPIAGGQFTLPPGDVSSVSAADVAALAYPIQGAHQLVFVNGRYAPALSLTADLPAGVRLKNLAGALSSEAELLDPHLGKYAAFEHSGFTALNTAFLNDGAFLQVSAGVELNAPIHLIFVADRRAAGTVTYPRNLILLERGARAAVIESFVALSDGCYFTNAVTEIVVHDGASLEHTKIQRESEQAFHVGTTHIHQGRDSRVTSHSVTVGGAIARNNLDLTLNGSGIESTLLGLYLGRSQQLVDNHTSILHAHPNCSTREVYKGILDGSAHGVFNGKVYVTPEAQKTDAKQTNRNLLLSDRARIDTKPQLEIFADDVKCTHGATVGRLDQHSMFYLQSRGIGGALARKILTYAFAAEVLEEIPYESVRHGLEALVMSRLDERSGL